MLDTLIAKVPTGYKTQSEDTSIEAELVQFELWRKLTPSQKEVHLRRIAKRIPTLVLKEISHQFKSVSFTEVRQQYIRKRLGQQWADVLSKLNYQGEVVIEDPIWLIYKLASIFAQLNISYYVGGSVASSLQGEMRYTEDLDLVINIQPTQVQQLIAAIALEFYISSVAVEEAISGKISYFNVIHLETTEKADIFVMGNDEFARSQMLRRRLYDPNSEQSFYICSPQDTILQKLLWFRLTSNQSQKQLRDILGVFKLQQDQLDNTYLNQWAEQLKLTDLLAQARQEAGIATN